MPKHIDPAAPAAPPVPIVHSRRFLFASIVGSACLSLAGAALALALRLAVSDFRDALWLQVLQHDSLLLGLVPLSATGFGLLVAGSKKPLSSFVLETALLLGQLWFVLSALITLAHGLLFPHVALITLPDEALATIGLGLLAPQASQLRRRPPCMAARDPHGLPSSVATRAAIDASCKGVVLAWYVSAVAWLAAGSLFAMLASIKLHHPNFLADWRWLTFGRVRPAHLNTMTYGWASMAAIGTLFWLQARLCRVRLPYREFLLAAAAYWNLVVAIGACQLLAGHSTSVEWLEFPPLPAAALAVVFVLLFLTSLRMLIDRRVGHIYVSQWYLFGAVFWFPVLYLAALMAIYVAPVGGTIKAVANWWYAHNVLGLWLTPTGLAAAYYLIPKILGRPVHSYYLSLIGFWSLALFYNWAGSHHLIGGPVPTWVVTLGIVGSIMMFVPVITVAINHHLTMVGHFRALQQSMSLRFIVFGAMSYTLVSLQGSLMALRAHNEITHFTHYTVAHAHLGVYAFFTMIMFGSMYYIVPRISRREWWSPRLVRLHFWASAIGISTYFVGLSIGGFNQGRMMAVAETSHLDIVRYTVPYLIARSGSGVLLSVAHLSFAYLLWRTLRQSTGRATNPRPRSEAT